MDNVERRIGQYQIVASSSLTDEHIEVLKHGDTFGLFDQYGDIQSLRTGSHGLYHEGTRFLSRFVLTLNGVAYTNGSPGVSVNGTTATKTTAAASVVGVPSPAGVLAEALEVLRQLDEDDLILLADIDLDPITASLAQPTGDATARQRAVRLRFATPRKVAVGPGAGQPSAERTLLAYRQAEPGCP